MRGRLILLVCFATVPAILFIFFVAVKERESALKRMETEATHLGSLASREHAHELNGARNLVNRLSAVLAKNDEDSRDLLCPEYLPTLLAGFPQFANIGVASVTGDVICSAAPIEPEASLKKNAAFERALNSSDVETGTYIVGFVGRPVLHLCRSVRDQNGSVRGVVFVAVELGWLDQLARQANLPTDYSLIITDRMGHVLARSGETAKEFVKEQSQSHPALTKALQRPRGVVAEIGSPPSPKYFVATPMEGMPGVFVVASLPYDRVRSAANLAFYRTLIGLVLVTIFAVVSAILAAEFSVLRVLRSLTRVTRRFGAGDLSARAPIPGTHGELRELALSFSAMADALAARDEEAREAQARLRALSHRLQVVRDEEAGRIARELHDELGQILTGLKMELTRLRRSFAHADPAEQRDRAFVEMTTQIDQAIDAVRRISYELRPPVLDRLGLAAALDWLVRDFESKGGLAILLRVSLENEAVDNFVSTAIFRLVQEALTNVLRHADATEVSVELHESESALTLTISDNGKGIRETAAEGRDSLGILGMRERVGLLGGSFRIAGAPGTGTTISVVIPSERLRMKTQGANNGEES